MAAHLPKVEIRQLGQVLGQDGGAHPILDALPPTVPAGGGVKVARTSLRDRVSELRKGSPGRPVHNGPLGSVVVRPLVGLVTLPPNSRQIGDGSANWPNHFFPKDFPVIQDIPAGAIPGFSEDGSKRSLAQQSTHQMTEALVATARGSPASPKWMRTPIIGHMWVPSVQTALAVAARILAKLASVKP